MRKILISSLIISTIILQSIGTFATSYWVNTMDGMTEFKLEEPKDPTDFSTEADYDEPNPNAAYIDNTIFHSNKDIYTYRDNIWSYVFDNEGNVWYIENDNSYAGVGAYYINPVDAWYSKTPIYKYNEKVNYTNQTIKKYDVTTKKIITIKRMKSMSLTYNKEKLTNYRAYKLTHDPKTNKIYVSGKYATNNGVGDYRGALYQINPEFKLITADPSFNFCYGADSFSLVTDNGEIIYSRAYGEAFYVYILQKDGTAKQLLGTNGVGVGRCNYNDTFEAVMTDDYLYVMLMNVESTILKKFPLKEQVRDETDCNSTPIPQDWMLVKEIKGKYDSISAHEGKFYMSKKNNVKEVEVDGTIRDYIRSSNIDLSGDLFEGTMFWMVWNPKGNLTYYDSMHGAVREISKY